MSCFDLLSCTAVRYKAFVFRSVIYADVASFDTHLEKESHVCP